MNIDFIKSNEKKKIVEELNDKFGITELPYLLIESGKEKIRAFSGSLSKEEIQEIADITRVETIGLYFLKREHDIRLSLDAPHLIKDQIIKGIIRINDEQFHLWIRGNDLQIDIPQGTYIIEYKGDFLGCSRSNGNTLFNYMPKDRRLRK